MRRVTNVLAMGMVLLLGACSSSSGTVACSEQFWSENLSLGTCLPEGWKALTSDTLRAQGVPEETVAAFQSLESTDGQFNTVTVTKEPLAQEMSSSEYGEANILAVSGLPDYQRRDKQSITVDGSDAILHVFSARPFPDKPVKRYYQVSVTKDKVGYTFTGSLPLSVDDNQEKQIMTILKAVTFVNPAASDKS